MVSIDRVRRLPEGECPRRESSLTSPKHSLTPSVAPLLMVPPSLTHSLAHSLPPSPSPSLPPHRFISNLYSPSIASADGPSLSPSLSLSPSFHLSLSLP